MNSPYSPTLYPLTRKFAKTTYSKPFTYNDLKHHCLEDLIMKIIPILVALSSFMTIGISSANAETIFHSDGTSTTIVGNTAFHSDGSTSTQVGNTTFNSDGSSTTQVGNTFFNSDGSSSTRVGNTYFHSDGSSTTQVGNTYFNSDGTSSTRVGGDSEW